MKFFKKAKKIYREQSTLLLIRWNLFECALFSIKVHKLITSDPGCQHDHPWSFISFLMKGGYVEHTPGGSKVYSRFSLLYRPAQYIHRLEIHQPVWTLVITFKKTRQWGFFTKAGWMPWYKYTPENECN